MRDESAKERMAVRAGGPLILREEAARSAAHAVLLHYRDPEFDADEAAAKARNIGVKAAEEEGGLDGAIRAAVEDALKSVRRTR